MYFDKWTVKETVVLINDVHRLKNSEPEPSEPTLKEVWALDWAWIQNLEPEPGFKI